MSTNVSLALLPLVCLTYVDEAQRKTHKAQSNLIVAYSVDEHLYPVGPIIMRESRLWPGDVGSLRISAAALRPLLLEKLAAVPSDIKVELYQVGYEILVLEQNTCT